MTVEHLTQKTELASLNDCQYYCWVTVKEAPLVNRTSQTDPLVETRGVKMKLKIRQQKTDWPTPAAQQNRKFNGVNKTTPESPP